MKTSEIVEVVTAGGADMPLYAAGQRAYVRQPLKGKTYSGRQKRRIFKAIVGRDVLAGDETAVIQEEGQDPVTVPVAWLAGPVYEVS